MIHLAILESHPTTSTAQNKPSLDMTAKLFVFDREMMLLDKSSGVAIEEVDDATAVHYFLQWLHEKRVEAFKRKWADDQIVCAVALRGEQSVE